ncbi:heat shock factor 2-binding protein-like [Belonocnema kinseyi]|uniref:heat shock factor 2-binding protein-like n=1 Tax=Belonocnema kinseyi TaxID=2817044 RepID=UPI00143DC6AF|nr:heat shock factor 2-binding protein-like [Belonocnema kinseyi]
MDTIEPENHGSKINTCKTKKDFEKLTHTHSESDWKQTFPHKLNRSSSKNICILEEPVVKIKKMGSDALLRVHEELSDLQHQLEIQRKKLLQAEEEKLILQEQLLDHSKFSTSLGAILGNLLWHASNVPRVIDIWISKLHSKFDEFLGAVNGTFSSFIKTYGEEDLPIDSDECQFVMSLLGITANVTAIPEGRQFIVTRATGEDLIRNFVEYFSYFPTPPKYPLWRLILTILYNVSVNATGVQWLLNFQVADNVLSQCLKESTPKDLNLLCLSILHSITCDLTDPKHLQEILQSIPLEKMDKIALTGEKQIIVMTREIKNNLKKARRLLHFNKQKINNK